MASAFDKNTDLDANNILNRIINMQNEVINLDSKFEIEIDTYLKDFENSILKKFKEYEETENIEKKITEIEILEENLEKETDLLAKNFYLLESEFENQKTLSTDLSQLEDTLKRELENLSLIKEKEEINSNDYNNNKVSLEKEKALEWLKKDLKSYKEAFQIVIKKVSSNVLKIEVDNLSESKIKLEIEIKIEKSKFIVLNVFPKIDYEKHLIYLSEEHDFDLSYFIICLVIEVLNKYCI